MNLTFSISSFSDSNHKVWELFVLSAIYFPPSRDLEKWLCSYVAEHLKFKGDDKLPVFAKYVLKKLHIIIKAGPRGRLPTAREIERHRVNNNTKNLSNY